MYDAMSIKKIVGGSISHLFRSSGIETFYGGGKESLFCDGPRIDAILLGAMYSVLCDDE